MNPVVIVLKNMKLRLLSTLLTVASVALASALVIAVQTLERETEQNYTQTSVGYDLILAAPGSRMQTTLNTIYHLETSTGVIPNDVYIAALNDQRIERAFPFFVGDNYRGVRIIGTSAAFINESEPRVGHQFDLAEGRNFEAPFEAVIGSRAAERLGIGIGHRFYMTHGVSEIDSEDVEPHVHDEYELKIVGILESSRTANDNVIFTSTYTTYVVHYHDHDHDHGEHNHGHTHEHGHSHQNDEHSHTHGEHKHTHSGNEGHDHGHGEHNHGHSHDLDHDHDHHDHHHSMPLEEFEERVQKLDAVLLKFNNQAAAIQLAGMLNMPTPENPLLLRNMQRDPFFAYKDDLMAVIPAVQIQELMSIVGNAEQVLRAIGWLVFIVALFGILAAMYNTMEDRRRDIAIMRSLGAKRTAVFSLILMEAAFITALGCLIGLVLGMGIVSSVAPYIAESAGIIVSAYAIEAQQFVTLLLFVLLGVGAGIIPALKAYRTDVVTNLAP